MLANSKFAHTWHRYSNAVSVSVSVSVYVYVYVYVYVSVYSSVNKDTKPSANSKFNIQNSKFAHTWHRGIILHLAPIPANSKFNIQHSKFAHTWHRYSNAVSVSVYVSLFIIHCLYACVCSFLLFTCNFHLYKLYKLYELIQCLCLCLCMCMCM